MRLRSKLPDGGITIFAKMSALAKKHNAINMGQGFPDFDCDPTLRSYISTYLNDQKNQYCQMAGLLELRETLSLKIKNLYNHSVDPKSEITITAGATQAIFTAITALVHEGDEVIIIEPAYDCYKPTIELVKAKCISYSLSGPEYKIDWNELERLVTDKTSMIMINTPHNPIGKVFTKDDMESLEKIIDQRNIVVLSDEVYEHLVYDKFQHQSVLRFPNLYRQSIAVYSFGKTLHATGWKIGYAVGPPELMREFRKVHQWNVYSVNSFVQYGINDYLQDESNYLGLSSFYQEKRDYLNELLAKSRLIPIRSEGTYFQLFNYSEISKEDDISFSSILTTKYGVATIPLSPFSSTKTEDRMIRICFAKNNETLEKAAYLLNKI